MDTQKPDSENAVTPAVDFSQFDTGLVYIKPIDAGLVPGLNEIPAGTIVYAIHAADGRPLALEVPAYLEHD